MGNYSAGCEFPAGVQAASMLAYHIEGKKLSIQFDHCFKCEHHKRSSYQHSSIEDYVASTNLSRDLHLTEHIPCDL